MLRIPVEKNKCSEKDTAALAVDFAAILKGGEVICFNGQLGAGKTYFIKNMLKGFKINNVSSPTFALVNQYTAESGGCKFEISHFDFYRIKSEMELYDIGFEEYLSEENNVTLIEWAELFPDILPHKRIDISITVNEDFSRNIKIQYINS